jgi:hypothetical protein
MEKRTMPSQRDVLRDLVAHFGMNEEKVIQEYAAAERRGEVERKSNKYGIGSVDYARALWRVAVRKGWIR